MKLDIQNRLDYDHNMIRFRYIFACILLLISFVLTGGVVAAAKELYSAETSAGCCDKETTDSTKPAEEPCTKSDCQCISCLLFVTPSTPCQLSYLPVLTRKPFNHADISPPSDYMKSIDYPPEFS